MHVELYHLTHERGEYTRGIDKLDRAIALKPSDSILLFNSASIVWDSAVRDILGNAVDFKLLKRSHSGVELLQFLYDDATSEQKVIAELRKHPGTIKARNYLEKLLVLSPKWTRAYLTLDEMYTSARDLEGLRALLDRLSKVELDQEESNRKIIDGRNGKDDAKNFADMKVALARMEEVLEPARVKVD